MLLPAVIESYAALISGLLEGCLCPVFGLPLTRLTGRYTRPGPAVEQSLLDGLVDGPKKESEVDRDEREMHNLSSCDARLWTPRVCLCCRGPVCPVGVRSLALLTKQQLGAGIPNLRLTFRLELLNREIVLPCHTPATCAKPYLWQGGFADLSTPVQLLSNSTGSRVSAR